MELTLSSPTPIPIPSPVSNPVAIPDFSGFINGVIAAFKGGTTTEIIASVFLLVVLGFYIFYQSKINQIKRDVAKDQSDSTTTQVQNDAANQSNNTENQVVNNQKVLNDAERKALRDLLDSLPDNKLIQVANLAFGVKMKDITGPLVSYPLSKTTRLAIYQLYGLS